jgi:hypothetical protein
VPRIERATPWKAHAGCGVLIGAFLMLFGGGIVALALHHDDRGLPMIVGGAFALAGVFVLYGGIHQWLASASPETVLEIETLPLQRGERTAAVVVQPGPLDLKSLHVNLVCLQTVTKIVQHRNGTERQRFTKQIWDANVLDVGAVTVLSGENLRWDLELDVPRDAPRSGDQGENRSVEWRVEIWGRVRGRPDFMHPFIVEVR